MVSVEGMGAFRRAVGRYDVIFHGWHRYICDAEKKSQKVPETILLEISFSSVSDFGRFSFDA